MRRSKEASSAAARTEDPVNDLAAFREKKKKGFPTSRWLETNKSADKKSQSMGGGRVAGGGERGGRAACLLVSGLLAKLNCVCCVQNA